MHKPFLVIVLGLFLLVPGLAGASIVLQLSEQQMSLKAEQIVRGRVVKKESRWETKQKRIYTYITISVLDRMKGSKAQEVTIRQLGGSARGYGMYVPGTAKFRLGEEVVLFLEKANTVKTKNLPTYYHVMGMSYGKFSVIQHPKTKLRYMIRDVKGLSLAKWNAKGKFQYAHAHKKNQPLLLTHFTQRVHYHLLRKPVPKTIQIPVLKLHKSHTKLTPVKKTLSPTLKK